MVPLIVLYGIANSTCHLTVPLPGLFFTGPHTVVCAAVLYKNTYAVAYNPCCDESHLHFAHKYCETQTHKPCRDPVLPIGPGVDAERLRNACRDKSHCADGDSCINNLCNPDARFLTLVFFLWGVPCIFVILVYTCWRESNKTPLSDVPPPYEDI